MKRPAARPRLRPNWWALGAFLGSTFLAVTAWRAAGADLDTWQAVIGWVCILALPALWRRL